MSKPLRHRNAKRADGVKNESSDDAATDESSGGKSSASRTSHPYRHLRCRKCWWCLVSVIISIAVFMVFIAPVVFIVFPNLAKHIVYLNSIKIPVNVDLSDPTSIELYHTRSYFFHVEDGIDIGVWHMLPKALERADLTPADYDKLLSSGLPIMLYCHGNTGTRGTDHRVLMYRTLSELDYHVVAADYRGFGDSSGTPTSEDGVVKDVVMLYKSLREKAGPKIPIHIWGHSLGTGISTRAVRYIIDHKIGKPASLVLESPFNNVFDAAMNHPFSTFFKPLWWFDDVFFQSIRYNGIYLQSDEHILHIDIPVLILHAQDDHVVPYSLGIKLYEASKKRPASFPPVSFYSFSSEKGLHHKWICIDQSLPNVIRHFMNGEVIEEIFSLDL